MTEEIMVYELLLLIFWGKSYLDLLIISHHEQKLIH